MIRDDEMEFRKLLISEHCRENQFDYDGVTPFAIALKHGIPRAKLRRWCMKFTDQGWYEYKGSCEFGWITDPSKILIDGDLESADAFEPR